MHLDLECLESFVVLAREQHYGRAAARLQVTSPALTKRIRRLERQLKIRLLERSALGVLGLTRAGVRVAAQAESLLEHEHELRRAALEQGATVNLGIPRLGSSDGVNPGALKQLRHLLRLHRPDVTLVCRLTPLTMTTDWVLQKRVDVQLVTGAVQHPKLTTTPVGAVQRMAIVSARSEWADADLISIHHLLEQPMLHDRNIPDDFMRPFWLGDVRPAEGARLINISPPNYGTVLKQVAMGTGVTVLLPEQANRVPAGVHALSLVDAPLLPINALRLLHNNDSAAESLVKALQATPPLIC